MVSVLLDGVNIDELKVVWVDVKAGKVGVRRKSPDAFPAVDRNFGPVVLELTGEVRFTWSLYAADLNQDIRDRLAKLYPEVGL